MPALAERGSFYADPLSGAIRSRPKSAQDTSRAIPELFAMLALQPAGTQCYGGDETADRGPAKHVTEEVRSAVHPLVSHQHRRKAK